MSANKMTTAIGTLLVLGVAAYVAAQSDAAPTVDAESPPQMPKDANELDGASSKTKASSKRPKAPAHAPTGELYPHTEHSMLALSWQPAFCQTHRSKPECRDESPDDLQAKQFSLHGLWPDGCAYKGVPEAIKQADMRGRWRDLPELELSAGTEARLAEVMPGVRSQLDRHEWFKHGTCDGRDAEGYYATSIALLDQINGSKLRSLFTSNVGQRITLAEAREALDRSFGDGAGEALVLKCKDGMVEEVRLRLGRPLNEDTPLDDVLRRNTANSCRGGRVDPGGP